MKLLLIIAILTASLAALNIEREVLENGITVLSIEAHKIPVVDLQVVAYAGSYYDPRRYCQPDLPIAYARYDSSISG